LGFFITSFTLDASQMDPSMKGKGRKPPGKSLELARVLLVDDDATSRLTLQAVLRAGGYSVDAAASTDEAVGKLHERQYELVLSDVSTDSREAGLEVIAHAKLMDYQPAVAMVTSYRKANGVDGSDSSLIEPEDLPGLLGRVADLISQRAARMVEGQLKQA
jgi:CheY-like chemotaxis protein